MEFWPADHRPLSGKQKVKIRNAGTGCSEACHNETMQYSPAGPIVWPGDGSSTVATLRPYREPHGKTHLRWNFASRSGSGFRVLKSPAVLFPGRPSKPGTPSRMSTHRKAEEGVRFLRQRYPDVDIPFEIIKEAIEEDMEHQIKHDIQHHPRNCLALVNLADTNVSNHQTAFLFPMGELNNQLNLSRSLWSRTRGLLFDASPQPVVTFDTPIRQIVSSTSTYGTELPTFAVRTMSFCSIFSVATNISNRRQAPLTVHQLVSVKAAEIGVMLDVAASPFNRSQILLVNESGEITLIQATNGGHDLLTIGNVARDNSSNRWHTCWGRDHTQVLRANHHRVEILDIRNGMTTTAVAFGPNEHILSLEGSTSSWPGNSHRIVVTTDKRISWVDERYPTIPLLSWRHLRAQDSTLGTNTMSVDSVSTTFLMSQRNGLLSMLDVSSSDELLQVHSCNNTVRTTSGSFNRIGHAFHGHPASSETGINLVELSDQGALLSSYLDRGSTTLSDATNEVGIYEGALVREWGEDMKKFAREMHDSSISLDPSSLRESYEVDFENVYNELISASIAGFPIRAEIEEVRDMLDRMPRIWQELDHPLEHILTTYDVAINACSEPDEMGRSEFLTSTLLDSRRVNLAFHGSQFPKATEIAQGAAWSWDLSEAIQSLKRLDDTTQPNTEQQSSIQAYTDAERQLSLDTSLYAHVYSPVPLSKPKKHTRDDSLERATEKMSLAEARMPPHLSFSFLKPRPVSDQERSDAAVVGEVPDAPLGARMLLAEWDVGTDPRDYEYVNPYPDVPTPAVKGSQSQPSISQLQKTWNRSQDSASSILRQPLIRPAAAPPRISISQNSVPIASQSTTLPRSSPGPSKILSKKIASTVLEASSQTMSKPSIGLSQGTVAASSQIQSSQGRFSTPKEYQKKPKKRMGGF